MIINKQTKPERDLYYLGGEIIELMDRKDKISFDYFELYNELKKSNKISLNLFTLTLDWLFIIGSVKIGKNGEIEKCF